MTRPRDAGFVGRRTNNNQHYLVVREPYDQTRRQRIDIRFRRLAFFSGQSDFPQ